MERPGEGAVTRRVGGRRILPGLALVAVLAAAATLAAAPSEVLSPLVVGIALGAVVANLVPPPALVGEGVAWAARTLLRAGIVLLGLRLSLGDLGDLGVRGLLVVGTVVTATFVGTRWLARRLGVGSDLGLLVATGYSICGASAIAAMNATVRADEDETAYSITLVTLCGTLSIAVLPAIGHVLGLGDVALGTWIGGAVHDVGQVVAAASIAGDATVEAATVVKLTRVVLLAPLVAIVALRRRRVPGASGSRPDAAPAARPPVLPLFVVGFLAMIVVRTVGVLGDGALDLAGHAERVLLTAALTALGLGVRIDRMRALGGRPLVLGLAAWVLVAGVAGLGTALVGP